MKCQSQKDKYHIISLYLESKIVKFTEAENKKVAAGGWGEGGETGSCSVGTKL